MAIAWHFRRRPFGRLRGMATFAASIVAIATPARWHPSTHPCHQWTSDGALINRHICQTSRVPAAKDLLAFLNHSFRLQKQNWHSKGGHGRLPPPPLATVALFFVAQTIIFQYFPILNIPKFPDADGHYSPMGAKPPRWESTAPQAPPPPCSTTPGTIAYIRFLALKINFNSTFGSLLSLSLLNTSYFQYIATMLNSRLHFTQPHSANITVELECIKLNAY